jgi:hypothetical protein
MPRDAAGDAADAPRTRRERADDAADAPASPSAPPRAEAEIPEWLERCRAEARPSFDVSAYRWPEIFAALFRTEAWGAANHRAIDAMHELTELPETPPTFVKLAHSYRHAGRKLPREWRLAIRPGEERRAFARLAEHSAWREFEETYERFVKREIAPLCGDAEGVVYQCPPTLRCAMPSRAPTILMHRDGDYPRHQPCEINFWVPITDVWGNNTLWIESAPDVGDFAPVEMKHGSFLRFNGHDARHFTRPNDTGKTRVSFDLRCVPVSLYKQHGGGVGRARDKGKIGDYRAKRTGPVTLRPA